MATLNKPHIVYFIEAIGTNRIKIGATLKTGDALSRMAGFQIGSPFKLQLLSTTTKFTELEIHKGFASSRLHGEWFEATEQLRKFIQVYTDKHDPLSKRSIVQFDFRMPPALHKEIKPDCAQKGISMNSYILSAIREKLDRETK